LCWVLLVLICMTQIPLSASVFLCPQPLEPKQTEGHSALVNLPTTL
jgi:hypothetical protein